MELRRCNMDLTSIMDYIAIIIVAFCFAIGYCIQSLEFVPNKYIPTIMLVLGTFFSIWMHSWAVTPEVVVCGMISGLASTGLYEAITQIIWNGKYKEEGDDDE